MLGHRFGLTWSFGKSSSRSKNATVYRNEVVILIGLGNITNPLTSGAHRSILNEGMFTLEVAFTVKHIVVTEFQGHLIVLLLFQYAWCP